MLAERKNESKLRWRNFPRFLLRPLAQIAHFGEGKYETFNFLKGGSQLQYLDCIDRHLDSYTDPKQDDLDTESKISHLAHVAWNALTAIYMLEKHPELDDRYKPEKNLGKANTFDTVIKGFQMSGRGSCVSETINLVEKISPHFRDFLIKKGVMNLFLKNVNPLNMSFDWADTPEGYIFWAELFQEYNNGK